MEVDYNLLGMRIRRIRKEKNYTQSTLAEQVGIETSNISHIERGVSKVSLGTIVKIANVLNVSIDDLLCDSILCEKDAFDHEIVKLMQDCSPKELRFITDMVRSLKETLRLRDLS